MRWASSGRVRARQLVIIEQPRAATRKRCTKGHGVLTKVHKIFVLLRVYSVLLRVAVRELPSRAMLRRILPEDFAVLLQLRVENYAVIDNAVVEFGRGLNLLSGETGAGKSLLVDALALLLGEKASAEVVRHGAEKAVLAAVFECEGDAAGKVLEANGISSADEHNDDQIIVRREIATGGKGRVFVNNQPATVAVLRQLAPALAAVHTQNESILNFSAGARLELLDEFAGNAKGDAVALEATRAAFSEWSALRARIAELQRDEQDRLRLVDLWAFQKKEIESAHPELGEDERLEAEKRILANAEKVHAAAAGARDLLYGGETFSATPATSAAGAIRAAARHLEELARYDGSFRESLAALEQARIAVEDLGATLRDYAAHVEASPERLAEIEDRLALLDRLKRKYGATLAQVIAFGEEAARKLNEVENRDVVLADLNKDLALAAEKYLAAARTLSRLRYAAAKQLEKLVEAEVNDLAMKATFRVAMAGTDEEANWTATGFDRADFLIATNPGEPMQPLEHIASGGELSRTMLALKVCVQQGAAAKGNGARRAATKHATTLVFDEIDSGIGGRAAEAVGRKLKQLARRHQVLCVTHLPQIASFADQHFVVEKREAAGRTRTAVRALEAGERAHELARMMSGAKLTETSLKHAEQMLKANA